MDYEFISNKYITDIGGNIYDFDIILNLKKLNYFGITLQPKIKLTNKEEKIKREKEEQIEKLKNEIYDTKNEILNEMNDIITMYNLHNNKKKRLITEIDNFYIYILKLLKYKLNEDTEKEILEIYCNKKSNVGDLMLDYEKKETEIFNIDEEINKNLVVSSYIFFVRFIDYYKGKIIVKVTDLFFPIRNNLNIYVGQTLKIKHKNINFVTFNKYDPFLYHFKETNFIQRINSEYPHINDEQNSNINIGSIVNVILKGFYKSKEIERKSIEEEDFWIMKIINYDYDRVWYIGITLPNFKAFDYQYNFKNIYKVGCIYRFNRNNIIEKIK